jgi:2-polyprenyl-3-methyl-5-hydroxy-6-metoxy-1,4-benzoquinol methylase
MVQGKALPVNLKDPLFPDSQNDILIAEVERFGLPLRVVLNKKSGLLRSDPYYNQDYINFFYQEHYRKLYNPDNNYLSFFYSQVANGVRLFNFLKPYLPSNAKVLDFGCGMGGSLIPFLLEGHDVYGVDYGTDYIRYGKRMHLKLEEGGFDVAQKQAPFDVIILSHVLEHINDLDVFLPQLRSVMGEKGIVYIEVPGIQLIPKWYNHDIQTYLQNAHCWHFSAQTLKAVLIKYGFDIVYIDDHISCILQISDGNAKEISIPVDEYSNSIDLFNKYEDERIRLLEAENLFYNKLKRKVKHFVKKLI